MITKKTSLSALEVGLYFLYLANKEKKPITNKKLQKLVYYAQVWSFALNDKKLFNDKIEAWVHGPAIPKLYSKFKVFEFNPIKIDTKDAKFRFNPSQKKLLDNVWKVYGKYDAEYLEALTHSELPWQEARQGLEASDPSSNAINLETAKLFYAAKLKQHK